MTAWIDYTHASPEDRASTLGDEFRNIYVIRASFDGTTLAEVILDGKKVMLCGELRKALSTYICGSAPGEVLQ